MRESVLNNPKHKKTLSERRTDRTVKMNQARRELREMFPNVSFGDKSTLYARLRARGYSVERSLHEIKNSTRRAKRREKLRPPSRKNPDLALNFSKRKDAADNILTSIKRLKKIHPKWSVEEAIAELFLGSMKNSKEQKILGDLLEGVRRQKNKRRNPIEYDKIPASIAFLAYLINHPHMEENVPDEILRVLIDEGYWDPKKLTVTQAGHDFLDHVCGEDNF